MDHSIFDNEPTDPWSLPSLSNTWADPLSEGPHIQNNNSIDININSVPQSYREQFSLVKSKGYVTMSIISSLIDEVGLSSSQKERLLSTFSSHDLQNNITESKFYIMLALIALEYNFEGDGNIVSLQMRKSSLPNFPVAALIHVGSHTTIDELSSSTFPLSKSMAVPQLDDGWGDTDGKGTSISNTQASILSHSRSTSNDFANNSLSPPNEPLLSDEQTNVSIYNENKMSDNELFKWIGTIRDRFKPLEPDRVFIKEIPEKEGLLFKHINYLISHNLDFNGSGSGTKVTRRYSEFVWLLEILLKKYPFRVLPILPPKKFSGSSPDSQFLQKRRRGLSRFLNQLVKHPILGKEPLVINFLSVPTDLNTWKRQAKIDESIEFKGKKISTEFISNWDKNFMKSFYKCEQDIKALIEQWSRITLLVERHEKREQQQALDNQRFSDILSSFSKFSDSIYSSEPSDINSINVGLNMVSKRLTIAQDLLNEEASRTNLEIMESFKSYLDYLLCINDLFDRHAKMGGNSIPLLKDKIESTEAKLQKLNTYPDARGSEVDKLKNIILLDKQEIFNQLNRDWLIKECLFHEFLAFQETQYLIIKVFQAWAGNRLKFSDLHQDNISQLYSELQNMPSRR